MRDGHPRFFAQFLLCETEQLRECAIGFHRAAGEIHQRDCKGRAVEHRAELCLACAECCVGALTLGEVNERRQAAIADLRGGGFEKERLAIARGYLAEQRTE